MKGKTIEKIARKELRRFHARKSKKRGRLMMFFCYSCVHAIMDPDGVLYSATYCPRCGSGLRSEYSDAGPIGSFQFRHNQSDVYRKGVGYMPREKAKDAALLLMRREK